jgi:hypothetical protein
LKRSKRDRRHIHRVIDLILKSSTRCNIVDDRVDSFEGPADLEITLRGVFSFLRSGPPAKIHRPPYEQNAVGSRATGSGNAEVSMITVGMPKTIGSMPDCKFGKIKPAGMAP